MSLGKSVLSLGKSLNLSEFLFLWNGSNSVDSVRFSVTCQATLWPSVGGQSSSPDWVLWEPEGGSNSLVSFWPLLLGQAWKEAIVMACIEGAAGLGREDNLHLREGEGLQRWGNTQVLQSGRWSSEDWSQRLTATPAMNKDGANLLGPCRVSDAGPHTHPLVM